MRRRLSQTWRCALFIGITAGILIYRGIITPPAGYDKTLLSPPKLLDIRKNMWQAQKVIPSGDLDEVVFGMHAYYDDRDPKSRDHFIQLFLVMKTESHKRLTASPYCYLWAKHVPNPHVVKAQHRTLDIEMFVTVVGGESYHNVILSCPVSPTLKYNVVNISFAAEPHANLTNYMHVTYLDKNHRFEHKFGQCNANGISFGYMGDSEARWLVEWVEANNMFGITEFNLYNATMQVSPKYQRVLDYYKEKGILRIYNQIPPVLHYDTGRNSAEIAVRTGFNDCMYRNMYRYEYVVSIDLDEIIVPANKYHNYGELVEDLKTEFDHYASVNFHTFAYYRSIMGQAQNVSSDTNLVTTKYVKYSHDYRNKTFINPRKCKVGFSHFCLIETPGVKATIQMNQSYAEVHHYRDQCRKVGEASVEYCESALRNQKVSTGMKKYATGLYNRVKNVWDSLNI